MGGYQSVMANRQGLGSSGVGFGFVVAQIRELHPEKNICLAQDVQTGDQYELGLDKRGETAWPRVGDKWLLDRSMGHWALQCRITATQAPVFTGNSLRMDPDTLRLARLLDGLGLLQDGTEAGSPLPIVTGSRASISPAVQQIISILADRGALVDQTTAAPVPMDTWRPVTLLNGFTSYTSNGDDVTVRYKRHYDGTVSVEGRATVPATLSSGVLIFVIEAGYRPPVTKYQTTNIANGLSGTITYNKDGEVQLFDIGSNVPTRVLFHVRYSLT